MKVKVKADAFYEDSRWYKGQTLDVPDDFKASWAEPLEEEKPAPKKKASRKKKPVTETNGESEAAPGDGGGD